MDSMEEIYQKYAGNVYKYLMSLCHDPQVAEEITQETFYQAIRSIHKFDERSSLSTWLVGIAKNQYLVYLRKNPAYQPIEEMEAEPVASQDTETEVMQHIGRVEIMKILHKLGEPYREILYLRLFEDMAFKDIGEIMGKTENWARVTFYRGKEKLKEELKNYV